VSPIGTVLHADVVGSMLRPADLVRARAEMRAGTLEPEAYRRIEDSAVDSAIALQEQVGLKVVSDGEMRRDIFFGFFVSGINGLSMVPAGSIRFRNEHTDNAMEIVFPASVTEKIEVRECPAVAEFRYAAQRTDKIVKVTLPSPMLMLTFYGEASRNAYPDPFELAADAATAVERWMRELAEAGCRYIQIDAPELCTAYADERYRAWLEGLGIPADGYLSVGTELLASISRVNLPGVMKALHLCKGNGTQSWIGAGGYDEFARHVWERVDGFEVFLMEYDDDRSGGFEPLASLPDDKVAALGLVSTKWTRLEDPAALAARIDQAARFHPKEHLAITTQCGFASAAETDEQRMLTPETQRDKLRLVTSVADSVWA
jgi:5-methyltetrahydropteroyltriglutamate--homocysteine methyltransferase